MKKIYIISKLHAMPSLYHQVNFWCILNYESLFTTITICTFSYIHLYKSLSCIWNSGCYFQVGNSLKLGMPILTAFRTALGTWASWVEKNINTNRTQVFFRTFEPSHWGYAFSIGNMTLFSSISGFPIIHWKLLSRYRTMNEFSLLKLVGLS